MAPRDDHMIYMFREGRAIYGGIGAITSRISSTKKPNAVGSNSRQNARLIFNFCELRHVGSRFWLGVSSFRSFHLCLDFHPYRPHHRPCPLPSPPPAPPPASGPPVPFSPPPFGLRNPPIRSFRPSFSSSRRTSSGSRGGRPHQSRWKASCSSLRRSRRSRSRARSARAANQSSRARSCSAAVACAAMQPFIAVESARHANAVLSSRPRAQSAKAAWERVALVCWLSLLPRSKLPFFFSLLVTFPRLEAAGRVKQSGGLLAPRPRRNPEPTDRHT